MTYDALKSDSKDEYNRFVNDLISITIQELKGSRMDPGQERIAIESYISTAYSAHLSAAEVIDFFGVVFPSILDSAEYENEDRERALAIFDELNPSLFDRYYNNDA